MSQAERRRCEEGQVMTEAEIEVMELQAKDTKDCWPCQQLEEARKGSPQRQRETARLTP